MKYIALMLILVIVVTSCSPKVQEAPSEDSELEEVNGTNVEQNIDMNEVDQTFDTAEQDLMDW